jgi:WS/DGAT/MGAT family acyltransferase
MALLEGLEGGRWALATKTHHCMVDGVGSVDAGQLLLDLDPDGGEAIEAGDGQNADAPHAAGRAPGARITRPSPLSRLGGEIASLAPVGAAAQLTRMAVHGALHPREALASARAAVEMIVREELHGAPHTSLNRAIGTRRSFEVLRLSLDDMRTIKGALGGTVNDVVLTISASGLRALLLARGEAPPAQGLRAMVPMNVRLASEHLALGNKISSLFLELPVAEPSTLERYFEVVARSSALKSDGQQAAGTSAVLELAGLAPPVIHSAIAQALYATRLFNVTITNVPGPQQTLYALGAPLREVHPLVPLAAEHAVGVAIVSYDGQAFFGIIADRDAVPDLDVMLDAMRSSADELLAAARPKSKRAGAAAGRR